MRAAFRSFAELPEHKSGLDIDLGSRKRSEQRFAEHLDELQPLIDFVSDCGRLPRDNELSNQSELEEIFGSPVAFSLIRKVTALSAGLRSRRQRGKTFSFTQHSLPLVDAEVQ